MADTKITGVDEALKRLESLKGAAGKRAVRRALRRAGNVVLKAAREGAQRIDDPRTRNQISKNITLRSGGRRHERRAGGPMVRVGVRGGARNMEDYGEFKGRQGDNPGGDTWYWRLVEFGTSRTQAKPFMRPALQNNVDSATFEFTKYLGPEIDKELAKVK